MSMLEAFNCNFDYDITSLCETSKNDQEKIPEKYSENYNGRVRYSTAQHSTTQQSNTGLLKSHVTLNIMKFYRWE